MPDITGGTIRFVLRGEDQNLGKLLREMNTSTEQLAKSFRETIIDVKAASNAMRQHESVLLRTAQAQARLAVAQGRPAEAAKILQGALGQVTTQSIASINTQTQLVKVQAQAAAGASTLANSVKGVAKELGIFGALFVGQQIVGFAADLVNSANELEKQKAIVGALSKNQAEYASTLELARSQQEKFGGSLTKNLSSLGAFLNLSQRTGVELVGLENLARRLALVDPVQGFEGAAVALKEFFSGK